MQKALAECTYDAFDRLVEIALRERVAFALFAGDVYHECGNRLKAQLRFLAGLQKLDAAGIPTYVIHGNHDPLRVPPAEWPESAHVLSADQPETVEVVRDGQTLARVTGQSYAQAAVPERLIDRYPMPRRDGLLEVAMLHGSLEGGGGEHKTYAPFTLGDLQAKPYGYWALGHVHTARVLLQGPAVWAAYSGVLQGTNPRETGAKGAYLVEAEDGRVGEVTPLEVGHVRFVTETLDVTGAASPEALWNQVQRRLRELSTQSETGTVLRLTLRGRTPAFKDLTAPKGREHLLEVARREGERGVPWVQVEAIRYDLSPDVDLDAIRSLGDIDRRRHILVAAENPPEDLMKILHEALEPLRGKLPSTVELPSDEDLRKYLPSAAREAIANLNPEAQ